MTCITQLEEDQGPLIGGLWRLGAASGRLNGEADWTASIARPVDGETTVIRAGNTVYFDQKQQGNPGSAGNSAQSLPDIQKGPVPVRDPMPRTC